MSVTGSISRDVEKMKEAWKGALPKLAKKTSAVVADEVKRRTPKGRIIDPETGDDEGPSTELYDSVKPLPPKEERGVWVAGAFSDNGHAGYVDKGTRAHPIPRPGSKTVLRYWTDAQLHFARSVNHPGTTGVHMFERGLVAAEFRMKIEAEATMAVIFH